MYPFSYLPKISKNHTIEGIIFLKWSDNTCYKRPKIYLGVETFSYMEIILKSAVEPIPSMILCSSTAYSSTPATNHLRSKTEPSYLATPMKSLRYALDDLDLTETRRRYNTILILALFSMIVFIKSNIPLIYFVFCFVFGLLYLNLTFRSKAKITVTV